MSNDRGEYRSIRRVLLDGPDFQKLPERARWTFVALKLNAGPTGIDVAYPDALVAQIAKQTDVPTRAVQKSLDILQAEGWIRREANVLWIVGHLEHDPHMVPKDRKHRASIQRHVASLPRLSIVRKFIAAQPDWFPKEETAAKGLAWAIEGPSKGHRSTETETESETITERETKRATTAAATKQPRVKSPERPPTPWLIPSSRVWEARFGAGSFNWGESGRHFKPLHKAGHSPGTIADHLRRYLMRTEAQFVSPARFAKTFAEYAPTDPHALVDEWGCLTPYGERVTRPDGLKLA